MEERLMPWASEGIDCSGITSISELLTQSNLDWNVERRHIKDATTGEIIPSYYANTRADDNSVLGIVSPKYKIIQNTSAFAFLDELVAEGLTYEKSGIVGNGYRVWVLMKMPSTSILNDEVTPYLLFFNNHDGKGSFKVCLTPMRVACSNALVFAFSHSEHSWSVNHMGDIEGRILDARMSLDMSNEYMAYLSTSAHTMVNIPISSGTLETLIDKWFPMPKSDKPLLIERVEEARSDFRRVYNADDIGNFRNTGWGVVNAMSDYLGHRTPIKQTKTAGQKRFLSLVEGNTMMDKTVKDIMQMVA